MSRDDLDTGTHHVNVSLTARAKSRYFSEAELRRRLMEMEGALFWSPLEEVFLLRTERTTANSGCVTIKFVEEDGELTVINQTCDHYDWSKMEPVEWPVQHALTGALNDE